MTTLLLAGATGLVGQAVLKQCLCDPRIMQVVAPTRRTLPAHPRLLNPIVDFSALPEDAAWWKADAVICTLGTTIRQAGSKEAFRQVDHHYPLALATLAQRHGTPTFALTSAMGADPESRIFYSRTKGELERDLSAMEFSSLTLVRPGLLGGERTTARPMESFAMTVLSAVEPVLPQRYRVVPAEQVATVLLRSALLALPGIQIIESAAILHDD